MVDYKNIDYTDDFAVLMAIEKKIEERPDLKDKLLDLYVEIYTPKTGVFKLLDDYQSKKNSKHCDKNSGLCKLLDDGQSNKLAEKSKQQSHESVSDENNDYIPTYEELRNMSAELSKQIDEF